MKTKKILSLVLAFVMTFSIIGSSFASYEENTPKEEVVYTSVNPDGSIKGTYVVNGFELLENDNTIVDYGKYEEIKNLTSLENVKKENDKITIPAKKGKFFYQGDHPKKELPWNINLEFYQNGNKKTVQEIAGKEGNITIKGSIKINPKANPIYKNYYMGQFSIQIDSKNAIVEKAEGALLAYQGSIQMLNYTILPEKELDFTIELNSKKFEMLPFNFSAVPFNMDFDMPDLDKFTNSLRQLENGISQLNDGTNALFGGIKQYTDSSKLLYNAIKQISDGVIKTKDGQQQLNDGTKQFHNGLSQYTDGIHQLVSKMGEMGKGLGQLKFGLTALRDGSNSLTEGLKLYGAGLLKYTNGVKELSRGHTEFNEGLSKLSKESIPLIDAGKQLVDGSSQIYDGLAILDKLDFSSQISKEDMEKLGKIIDTILNLWNRAEKEIDKLEVDKLIDELIKINNYLSKLITLRDSLKREEVIKRLNIEDLEHPDVQKLLKEIERIQKEITITNKEIKLGIQLIDKIKEKEALVNKIKEMIKNIKNELESKLKPLKKILENYNPEEAHKALMQIAKFRSEYKKFHDGLVQYTNGTTQLVNAISSQLLPGSIKINEGLAKLGDGGNLLYTNFNKLIDGSNQITNGLSQIVEKLDFGDISQVDKLKTGIDLLLKNHSKILEGQSNLKDGLLKLSNGLGEYINGFEQFTNGGDKLKNGANKLSDGTNRLKNETTGMSDKALEGIEEAMKAFNKKGFKLESFVSEKNKNMKLVQFVYVSDSILEKQKEGKNIEDKKTSFWEKLWDIITFWN